MTTLLQIESFIPLWEWDIPKKKSKKKRADKVEKESARATAVEAVSPNGASIEELPDSGSSRPESRNARVEDVPEDS